MATEIINCKLLLIGNSSVGKSSLLLRFTDEQWLPEDETSATIGVDFRVCRMDVKGKKVKLSLWDTAGQERFRTITSSYYRGAEGIILVYDVSNRESFEALPRWFSELETYVSSSVVKMVVGKPLSTEANLLEFSRAVSEAEGRKFAESQGSLFLEVSAKTNIGVREAFLEVVEKVGKLVIILDVRECSLPPNAVALTHKGRTPGMPGNISLTDDIPNDEGGCSC
ncbi:ras-domain-containing protein [Hysterangium stoloniferum]|nr:ras-domain-containing protein [Hysterangium stoloniferum]